MRTNIARVVVNGLRHFALLVGGGAGLRAGASIGYSHYNATKTLNPF